MNENYVHRWGSGKSEVVREFIAGMICGALSVVIVVMIYKIIIKG